MTTLRLRLSLSLSALGLAVSSASLAAQVTGYDLLVSSRGTNSIKRYSGATGTYIDDFVAPRAGGLVLTQEVIRGLDGNLLVTGLGTNSVLHFDVRNGAFLGAFTSGRSLASPTKMSRIADTLLYVSQWGVSSPTVAVFDARSGAYLRNATGPFGQPMQHLLLPSGNMLLVAFDKPQVREIAADGTDLGPFTSGLDLVGPTNIWRHPNGDLLVADWSTGRIERFNGTTGVYIGPFITGLAQPEGWTIGPDGVLYIAEWTGNRVRRFDAITGASLGIFASDGGLIQPNSLLFIPAPPDFELAAPTGPATTTLGGSATLNLTLSPVGSVVNDGEISLSCLGLRPGWRCEFSPSAKVSGASLPAVVQLTVHTVPESASWPALLSLGLLVAALPAIRSRRWVLAVTLFVAAAACGGDRPTGPRSEDVVASFTVMATGEFRTHSATITVHARAD